LTSTALPWLGTVEATDEATGIAKAAKEFKTSASKLISLRRH